MARDTLLQALPPTRREIVMHLKTEGDASVDDLAHVLSMTASAVRQHIVPLEAEGLVDHIEVGSGPGRRKRRYHLTERGDALFPDRCGELAVTCAAALERLDPALTRRLVDEGLRTHYRTWLRELASLPEAETKQRLARLAQMFEANDFLPAVGKDDGKRRMVLRHCPFLGLARTSSSVCEAELALIREALPRARVERVAYRLEGARSCIFEIG
ncbi:MAG: transcriptional regulator [Dehalococcoidia bacterium]